MEELPTATPAEKRDRALVVLLLSTGARISEIDRLDRRDWAREPLTVGKGDKERVVTLTARDRDAVDDYPCGADRPVAGAVPRVLPGSAQ